MFLMTSNFKKIFNKVNVPVAAEIKLQIPDIKTNARYE